MLNSAVSPELGEQRQADPWSPVDIQSLNGELQVQRETLSQKQNKVENNRRGHLTLTPVLRTHKRG